GTQPVPGVHAVGGVLDGVALLAQAARQEVGDLRLVLDHQDADAHDFTSQQRTHGRRFTEAPPAGASLPRLLLVALALLLVLVVVLVLLALPLLLVFLLAGFLRVFLQQGDDLFRGLRRQLAQVNSQDGGRLVRFLLVALALLVFLVVVLLGCALLILLALLLVLVVVLLALALLVVVVLVLALLVLLVVTVRPGHRISGLARRNLPLRPRRRRRRQQHHDRSHPTHELVHRSLLEQRFVWREMFAPIATPSVYTEEVESAVNRR